MLVKSNCRTPFLGLPEGNCDFLKGTTLFRYSPFTSAKNIRKRLYPGLIQDEN